MKLKFRKLDILNAPQGYYLAHAISADYTLGAGVAKQLDRVYNLKDKLTRWHPNSEVGDCLTVDNVFNLVDKNSRYDEVDLDDLCTCFESMRNTAVALGVKKIAMPKIGCGCDNLIWDEVKYYLMTTFKNLDIEFLVCVLSDDDLEDDKDEDEVEDYFDDKLDQIAELNWDEDDFDDYLSNHYPFADEEDTTEDIACVYVTSEDINARSNDGTLIGIKTGEIDIEEEATKSENNEVLIGIDTYNRDEAKKYKFLFKTDDSYVLRKCE